MWSMNVTGSLHAVVTYVNRLKFRHPDAEDFVKLRKEEVAGL